MFIDVNTVIERLHHLTDERLAEFSRALDAELRKAHYGAPTEDLNSLTDVAAAARLILRARQAHAASARAHDRLRSLLADQTMENAA
ncbi:hypothetical protein [Streptantibioticus silvisoli]|uniref:Uncharacterized protein n=1 Tax=Streptantibioticus silvisoli TaxID=2705255 RepID=A0ABT6W255_9ACTN|nr:hypothetical protein [Streptantibioticus silvisoli]MDI5964823.1 hypothetical protein [Streptantibioticus silvisoli]